MVLGDDYFYYKCSECEETIVTLKPHFEPVQCSHYCVGTHIARIRKHYKAILSIDLENPNMEDGFNE